MRVGGFGGIAGLSGYLRHERIGAVVNATHPFAAQMSRHAFEACASAGVPLLVFTRPPWLRQPDDDWREVDDAEGAVAALGAAPACVFLTLGRLHLSAFAKAPQHRYLLRAIDPAPEMALLRNVRLIQARGPFDLSEEIKLMRAERVEILVTKNSGAEATAAKIEAARMLRLPVAMLRRPPPTLAKTVVDLADAMAWLDQIRAAHAGAS